nr:hypothetical protein [Tanacetum cinerariifolium]
KPISFFERNLLTIVDLLQGLLDARIDLWPAMLTQLESQPEYGGGSGSGGGGTMSQEMIRTATRMRTIVRGCEMETSATREYPSLIHTFFLTHTVGGVFLNPEDKALYDELLRLQGLGSNTPTGVPYTKDKIMAIVRGGKQQGHIPSVGWVLPGQGTVIPPPSQSTHSASIARLKKHEKHFRKQVNMFMSGSGGCGDGKPGDDKDGDEDEYDSYRATCRPGKPSIVALNCLTETMWAWRCHPGMSPKKVSHSSFSFRCIPSDMSLGKPILGDKSLGILRNYRWGKCLQLVRETLAESSHLLLDVDEDDLDLDERNIKQCKRKICDGHYNVAIRFLSFSGVAPYNDVTLEDLKIKHHFKSAPVRPLIPTDHHHLIASPSLVLDRIKSFSRGTSCGRDGLRAHHLMNCLSGAVIAILDELVSFITQVVNLFLGGKCPKVLDEYIASALSHRWSFIGWLFRWFVVWGWGVGGGEAILHAVNRLIEGRRDDVGLSILLVDFKNAFNLVDREGDPLGPFLFSLVLHPLICKITDSFSLCLHAWYLDDGTIGGDTLVVGKEDPRSRLEGIFPPNISRPVHGVKLLGGPASVDFNFGCELVKKRVSKTIELMIRLPRLMILNTKLLRHAGIFDSGPNFDDALCVFNTSMETDIMSNLSEIAAPKLMKKLVDIYFTWVTNTAKSTFSLSPRQMALWKSQMEAHTSDLLRVVPIFGLGQTMNGKTYRCVLCYRLGIPLFSVLKPCLACSRVFTGDIYGDHVVSCMGVIGIKHRHKVVCDTLVDICYRSGILAGKKVDIGLDGRRDKPLRPVNMLLYSWDMGLDVCVDLTGSSPLTQTGMADCVPGCAVIDAAQRKRVKYEAKCAAIGYGFLPFSFSSFRKLEGDAITLLKRIQKFSMTHDVGARAAIHIFDGIGFVIAKGVGAQLVSRLPTNFL